MPSSEPKAMEVGLTNLLKEYGTRNHDGDVHIKFPTMDQRLMGEKFLETTSISYLSTTRFEWQLKCTIQFFI